MKIIIMNTNKSVNTLKLLTIKFRGGSESPSIVLSLKSESTYSI